MKKMTENTQGGINETGILESGEEILWSSCDSSRDLLAEIKKGRKSDHNMRYLGVSGIILLVLGIFLFILMLNHSDTFPPSMFLIAVITSFGFVFTMAGSSASTCEKTAKDLYARLREWYSEEDLRHYEEYTFISNHRIVEKAAYQSLEPDQPEATAPIANPVKQEKDVISIELKDVAKVSIIKIFRSVIMRFHYRVPAEKDPERPQDLVKYYLSQPTQVDPEWDYPEGINIGLSKVEVNQVLKKLLSVIPNVIVDAQSII